MSSIKSSSKMGDNSKKNIVEIYTDWANHYLEKTKVGLRINFHLNISSSLKLQKTISKF